MWKELLYPPKPTGLYFVKAEPTKIMWLTYFNSNKALIDTDRAVTTLAKVIHICSFKELSSEILEARGKDLTRNVAIHLY